MGAAGPAIGALVVEEMAVSEVAAAPGAREVYERVWRHPAYRVYAPGERWVDTFRVVAGVEAGETVVDWGCGTGRAGLMLARMGCRVVLVDCAGNSLDPAVEVAVAGAWSARLTSLVADLTAPGWGLPAEHGYCTDVLEHLPAEGIGQALQVMLGSATRGVFFSISTVPDGCGPALIGAPLHLTIRPAEWWARRFEEAGGAVRWAEEQGSEALFHVVRQEAWRCHWKDGKIRWERTYGRDPKRYPG